ncbi:MAG TPA: hypothetical protein VK646_04115 [Actinomycetota bacterium]|nr:hypothetical protein [Actinomycetota bacterium]
MRIVNVGLEGIERADDVLAPAGTEPEERLVLVIWRDAFFDFEQKPADERRPDYLVHTVGFLVTDGPTFISLAQEILPDGEGYRAVTHIPLAVVERIEVLIQHDPGLSALE